MPYCRECHSRINKYDTDVCPYCGCLHPLEGVDSETVDITSQIRLNSPEYANYKPKTRAMAFMWSATLGFIGAPLFYLGYRVSALIHCLVCLGIILGAGIPLGINQDWIYPVIIVVSVIVINILFGLYYLFKSDLKDKNGEFIH